MTEEQEDRLSCGYAPTWAERSHPQKTQEHPLLCFLFAGAGGFLLSQVRKLLHNPRPKVLTLHPLEHASVRLKVLLQHR